MGILRKKQNSLPDIAELRDTGRLPAHIAIIMDGNGRWAEKRGLPRNAGHAKGSENFDTIATYCSNIGIKYLTVYAFSTENWKREASEVEGIFNLFRKYLKKSVNEMTERNVKLKIFGDSSVFPQDIKDLIRDTDEKNALSDGMQVNVCINYGGRAEIVRAAKSIAERIEKGEISADDVDEKLISDGLYSAHVPDPDLLIRTGGDLRVSNFLLWQIAYSEIYVTDTLWPAFSVKELEKAICSFSMRDRRFGGYGKKK